MRLAPSSTPILHSFTIKRLKQRQHFNSSTFTLSSDSTSKAAPTDALKSLLNNDSDPPTPPSPKRQFRSTLQPRIRRIDPRPTTTNWTHRAHLGAHNPTTPLTIRARTSPGTHLEFLPHHLHHLHPTSPNPRPTHTHLTNPSPTDLRYSMRVTCSIVTVPTADTPGTTLLLSFANKRYLLGSLAEGTQRAATEMGVKLLKCGEIFVTGRCEWRNVGGTVGMVLTLADGAATSAASAREEVVRKAEARARREGLEVGGEGWRRVVEEARRVGAAGEGRAGLRIFGPRNFNWVLATARRFVFRKGLPLEVYEVGEAREKEKEGEERWAPYWSDENVNVWAMSIAPDGGMGERAVVRPGSSRKRSFDEVDEETEQVTTNKRSTYTDHGQHLTDKEKDYLTVKAVVSEMFNSSWRLDTLHETRLEDVKMPAAIFVRDPQTKKIEKYTGPVPGEGSTGYDPDKIVLVRKPWPGALVDSLPPTQPAKEAVSYIIRAHKQRGKFDAKEAVRLKVPKGRLWAALVAGQEVTNTDGDTITSEMVLGPSRDGRGFFIADLPGVEYIDNLLARPEWQEPIVMTGVGVVIWSCGPGVALDPRIHEFIKQFSHLKHIISSTDYNPNHIAMDASATSTIRLRQVDPDRYGIPVHEHGPSADGSSNALQYITNRQIHPPPEGAFLAKRGQNILLEPELNILHDEEVQPLNIEEAIASVPDEVLEEAKQAQHTIAQPNEAIDKWIQSLPPGAGEAEIIALGTGSALPSKYRNVSGTMVKVPGWGNVLLDCGENTLGQLKRVFAEDELQDVFGNLRLITISHLHADHHLGTLSVIREWYQRVHNSQPAQTAFNSSLLASNRLAVIAEPAMHLFLHEFTCIEDYGYSHLIPVCLSLTSARSHRSQFFIPPSELQNLSQADRTARIEAATVEPSYLNLTDIRAARVRHCNGARAIALTFPSGFKLAFSGDCRPSDDFAYVARDATVCIHEATFDDELAGDALAKNHSTTSEALGVAMKMRAKACVLTHFSQRYQKIPVLETVTGVEEGDGNLKIEDDGAEVEEDEALGPIDTPDGPPARTTMETSTANGEGGDVVKVKVSADMKVCVAFDYMRIKVKDIPHMEKFTPALMKLLAEEEKVGLKQEQPAELAEGVEVQGKKKDKKNKKKEKNAA